MRRQRALLALVAAALLWPAAGHGASVPAEIHLAATACGDRLDEALVMLKSAVLASRAAVPATDRCSGAKDLFTRALTPPAPSPTSPSPGKVGGRPGEGDRGGEAPGFYRDVAAAQLEPWRERGIRHEDLDAAVKSAPWPLVKYQILGGKLYRSRECLFPPRCRGIEHFLLELAPELPDLEFLVNVQDLPVTRLAHPLPVFSFSKIPSQHADILYPAWAFWEGGPAVKVIPTWRWDLARADLLAAGDAIAWEDKKPLLFFRGSRTHDSRDAYVLHAQRHPQLWDVRYTLNQSQKQTDVVTKTLGITPAEPVAPRDHCAFRYLLNFDGVAASFRLKNLLACGGLVLYVDPQWVEFFYPKLVAGEHYVPLSRDPEEAERTLAALVADDPRARRIAQNGRGFIEQHLSLDDIRQYWRDLLTDYAALQRFAPRRDESLIALR